MPTITILHIFSKNFYQFIVHTWFAYISIAVNDVESGKSGKKQRERERNRESS